MNIDNPLHSISGKFALNDFKISREALVILLIFFGLFVGCLFKEVYKKTKIPLTPMLLLVGIFFGYFHQYIGYLGMMIRQIQHFHPYGGPMVFLPLIAFSGAYNSDWYIFKRSIWSVIILSTVGFVISTFLLAFSFRYVLLYAENDIDWTTILYISCILSMSDPVAVIALLREMGASNNLITLLDGESLISPCTSFVVFLLIDRWSKNLITTSDQVIEGFVTLTVGGILLGLIFGTLGMYWLRSIIRDDILIVSVTLVMSYLLFFVAENLNLHVSGIVAVITLGLFMSAVGRSKLYYENQHIISNIWSFLNFGGIVILYQIFGYFIGFKLNELNTIRISDWFKMVVFYFVLHIVRFIVLIILLPILRRFQGQFYMREIMVLTFGNLKGSLSLALALMIGADSYYDKRIQEFIIFYTACSTMLTNIINGAISRHLLKFLKVKEQPSLKKKTLKNGLKELLIKSAKKEDSLKNNKYFSLCKWNDVKSLVGIGKIISMIEKVDDMDESDLNHQSTDEANIYVEMRDNQNYADTRFRLLRILRNNFHEKYEKCFAGGDSTQLLVESCNVALENTYSQLDLWSYIFNYFTNFRSIKFFFKIKDFILLGNLAKTYITRHLAYIYEVTSIFIICAEETIEMQGNSSEQNGFIEKIKEELESEKNKAEEYIISLGENFPQLIRAIQTKRAAFTILMTQRQFWKERFEYGDIDTNEFEKLKKRIDRDILALDNRVFNWDNPSFHSFMMEFPIFSILTRDEIKLLLQSSKEEKYTKGQSLYEKGAPIQYVYIILKGTINDVITPKCSLTRSIGSVLSFPNLLTESNISLSSANVIVDSVVYALSRNVLKTIMKKNQKFEEQVYKKSVFYMSKLHPEKAGRLRTMEENAMNEFLHGCDFTKLEPQNKIKLESGGLLLRGEMKEFIAKDELLNMDYEIISEFSIIKESRREYICIKPSFILKFPGQITKNQEEHNATYHKSSILRQIQKEERIEKQFMELMLNKGDLLTTDIRVI